MPSQEQIQPAFPDKATPLVSYGYCLSFIETCVKHVHETFHAERVYLIASTSLTSNTNNTSALQAALGSKLIQSRIGMTPHTLMSEVLEIVNDCKELKVDCIVTLGGGSLSDGAKIVSFVRVSRVYSAP